MKKLFPFFCFLFILSSCYQEDEPLYIETKKKLIGKWNTKKTRRTEYKLNTNELVRSTVVPTNPGSGFEFTNSNFIKFSATRIDSDYLYSVTGENEITVDNAFYKTLEIRKLTEDSLVFRHTDATTYTNTRVVTDYYNVP